MRASFRSTRSSVAAVAFAVLVTGCARNDDIDLQAYTATIEPADVLYNQALSNLQVGKLTEASRKFNAVDQQHPYSEFARRSLVMGAFTDYRRGRYAEAISAAERYISLYPATEDAAYAQYIIGLSHFKQMPDVTRDLRPARDAIRAFSELKERYPDSEYVADAELKLIAARDQIAGKEMQTGRYYQERQEYPAAVNRFRNVVEKYEETRHVEEALARLVETYYAMGLVGEAQDAAAMLGHNFPDSEWYRDSYALLEGGERNQTRRTPLIARALGFK